VSAGVAGHPLGLAATCYAGAEPVALIEAAAKAGFDAIGLRLYRSPGMSYAFVPVVGDAPLIRSIKGALASTGLEFWDVFSFYLRPDTDVASLLPYFETGAELGAKYLLVLGDDPDWQRMVDNATAMCAAAASLGLTVGLEAPQPRLQMPTVQSAVELAEATGAQNASVVLDPAQYHKIDGDPDALRRIDPRLFPYIQLTDAAPDREGLIGPGTGTTPIKEILAAMPAGVPLSVEYPMPRDAGFSVEEWTETVYTQSRACLEG
jgi:sugar phosphate isomerase/epimerase